MVLGLFQAEKNKKDVLGYPLEYHIHQRVGDYWVWVGLNSPLPNTMTSVTFSLPYQTKRASALLLLVTEFHGKNKKKIYCCVLVISKSSYCQNLPFSSIKLTVHFGGKWRKTTCQNLPFYIIELMVYFGGNERKQKEVTGHLARKEKGKMRKK